MTLRHLTDVDAADWFVDVDAPWHQLAGQGPPGFEAHATVWFGGEDSQSYLGDDEIMAHVVRLAATHTTTAESVYFGLWDGWGELHDGGRTFIAVKAGWLSRLYTEPVAPKVRPAFDAHIVDGPKVDLHGVREYLLFHGPAADVGQWGQNPQPFGVPSTLPPASITWPEDRAWFIAADVDPDWLCVAGSRALVDAVLADPTLEAEPAEYGVQPPDHREDR